MIIRLLSFTCSFSTVILLIHVGYPGDSANGGGGGGGAVFSALGEDFWCPSKCTCSGTGKIIDCSSLGLKKVPTVPIVTERFHDHPTEDSLSLDMIMFAIVDQTSGLEKYLHNNLISSLHHHHFHMLNQLTYLILSGNRISDIDSEIFSDLHSLKYLILDGNNITKLSHETFKELSSIETISLAKNHLEVIPNDVFVNNNQLTLVNLQDNVIRKVHSRAFSGLKQLTALNLEHNLLEEDIFNALQGLQQLTTLRLNGNRIKELPLNGLELGSLKYLSLHCNNITRLPLVLMKDCSSLEILMLNENSIEEIGSTTIFGGCTRLVKLYFHKNHLRLLLQGTFKGLKSLEELYLCNNLLRDVTPGVFHGLNALVSIHLEWNELSFIGKDSFSKLPKLETIYLHHNNIFHIEPGAFVDLPCLKYMVLYRNHLRNIRPGVLDALYSLKKIQIDPLKCSCSLLPLATWIKRKNLNVINCINEDGVTFTITNLEQLCSGNHLRTSEHHEVGIQLKDQNPQHILKCPSKNDELIEKITLLEQKLALLHHKVLRLESQASKNSCQRKMCWL